MPIVPFRPKRGLGSIKMYTPERPLDLRADSRIESKIDAATFPSLIRRDFGCVTHTHLNLLKTARIGLMPF